MSAGQREGDSFARDTRGATRRDASIINSLVSSRLVPRSSVNGDISASNRNGVAICRSTNVSAVTHYSIATVAIFRNV